MQMTDVVADMLTRIRNANSAKHEKVDIPASNLKKAIAEILLNEGYITSYEVKDTENKQGVITVTLKYGEGKTRVIQGLRRVSKPGLRIYAACDELPRVRNGLGIAIISTSKGIMTDKVARKQNLGGEVLAFVWLGGHEMSRIGRMHINVPAGVTVNVAEGNFVTVKGPKGTLTKQLNHEMTITQEGAVITVTRPSDDKEHRALHGLTRALLHNMVEGVANGYSKQLDINGVGYRAQVQGKQLVMNLGYSHNVVFDEPEGIKFETPNTNTIVISGPDKQQVGQIAANIRSKRPPEPYLGKGIKYSDETIRRKAGKAGKSK